MLKSAARVHNTSEIGPEATGPTLRVPLSTNLAVRVDGRPLLIFVGGHPDPLKDSSYDRIVESAAN